MSIEVLKKQLKQKDIGKLYFFTGPEQYLIRYYEKQITDMLLNDELKTFNYTELTGKVSMNELMDAIAVFPVFSDRRLVIVRESTLFKGDVKEKEWSSFFESLPEYACVIFIQSEVDKRGSLYKALKKCSVLIECSWQNEAALAKWVMKVLSSYNKKINQSDAAFFVGLLDPDMTFMLLEIGKVVQYAGDKEFIDQYDILQVVSKSVKSKIFDLTDAVSQHQMGKAIQIVDELLQMKEPVQFIMAMVSRQIGILLKMKKTEGKRLSSAEIAKIVGIPPFLTAKVQRQAASFTLEKLKTLIKKCMETDLAVKTGKMEARTALELFILEMESKSS